MKITDEEQVWEIWTVYEEVMGAYLLKKTQNKELTKDLLHDILLKTHNACCSDIEIKNVRSWLFQIAFNTIADHFKKSPKSVELLEIDEQLQENDLYGKLAEFIEPMIDALPSKYSKTLKLSELKGLRQKEIAEELEISLAAVKSQVRRGRQLLKSEIHSCFHIVEGGNGVLLDFRLKTNCDSLQKILKKRLKNLHPF